MRNKDDNIKNEAQNKKKLVQKIDIPVYWHDLINSFTVTYIQESIGIRQWPIN